MSEFVSTQFWKPLGAKHPALWNLDKKDGVEKAYCCFYSNARDFSRFGSLVLHRGYYNGKQILDSNLLKLLDQRAVLNSGEKIAHYSYQWWKMNYKDQQITYARGIFGQYIIVIPERNMVVVRLGKKRGDKNADEHPADVYHYIDLAADLDDQIQEYRKLDI